MVQQEEPVDARRLARYKATALRLNIPLSEYLLKGASGLKYCSKCLKWKRRSSFLSYSYSLSTYAGVCKPCRKVKRKPAKLEGRLWGPALRAAKKLDITVEQYLEKRQQNQRWCTTHQGWFDASVIMDNPRYTGGSITRCRDCQKALSRHNRLTTKEKN